MEKKRNSLWLYAASGLIPFALFLINLALIGLAPFGDKTILFNDVTTQYLDFASYLKTIFLGENNLLYTFSKNLGGEMVSLIGYYLLSPFSILFAFASRESLPMVFTMVQMLKVSAAGVTFFYASAKRFGLKKSHLIFSTAYALMGYTTFYHWNIMWIEGVVILPLLALGLENLWQGKKPWLYTAALAYGLLTNFYIGYMLCIASVIFSISLMVMMEGTLREKGRQFGRFLGASCIGGFAVAFFWLPTFFSLLGGRAAAAGGGFVWAQTFNILGLAAKLVAGSANADHMAFGTPNIFCGIVTILLVVVFFLNGKNGIKKRIVALGVIGVLLVSFLIRGLDVIWHGFSPNNAYNFRYSFLFSYVLLIIAQYAWQQRREVPKVWYALSCGLLLVMCAGLVVMKRVMGLDFVSVTGIAVSAVTVLAAMVYFLLGTSFRRTASVVMMVACLVEVGANHFLCIREIAKDVLTIDLSGYNAYIQKTAPAVDAVKAMDSGFYRMEKTFERSRNDAMFYSYNGVSHFSSSQDKSVPYFMHELGMPNMEGVWAAYSKGSTAAVDTLLGVKYVLSDVDLASRKGYILRQTVNGVGIYENPYALPVAMLTDRSILGVIPGEGNCFSLQEQMLCGISGTGETVFSQENNWKCTPENLTETENGSFTKEDPEADASLSYVITVSEEKPLYLYFDAPYAQNVSLYLNGENVRHYYPTDNWDMIYAGTYAPGEQVEIKLVIYDSEITVDKVLFFYENAEAVSNLAQSIKSKPVLLHRESSSCLTGTVTTQEDSLLLLTIPYDEGWKLTVDGAAAEYFRTAGIFMAVPIQEGSHSFELRYVPRGIYAGCIISAAAIAAAVLWARKDKKKKQMP